MADMGASAIIGTGLSAVGTGTSIFGSITGGQAAAQQARDQRKFAALDQEKFLINAVLGQFQAAAIRDNNELDTKYLAFATERQAKWLAAVGEYERTMAKVKQDYEVTSTLEKVGLEAVKTTLAMELTNQSAANATTLAMERTTDAMALAQAKQAMDEQKAVTIEALSALQQQITEGKARSVEELGKAKESIAEQRAKATEELSAINSSMLEQKALTVEEAGQRQAAIMQAQLNLKRLTQAEEDEIAKGVQAVKFGGGGVAKTGSALEVLGRMEALAQAKAKLTELAGGMQIDDLVHTANTNANMTRQQSHAQAYEAAISAGMSRQEAALISYQAATEAGNLRLGSTAQAMQDSYSAYSVRAGSLVEGQQVAMANRQQLLATSFQTGQAMQAAQNDVTMQKYMGDAVTRQISAMDAQLETALQMQKINTERQINLTEEEGWRTVMKMNLGALANETSAIMGSQQQMMQGASSAGAAAMYGDKAQSAMTSAYMGAGKSLLTGATQIYETGQKAGWWGSTSSTSSTTSAGSTIAFSGVSGSDRVAANY